MESALFGSLNTLTHIDYGRFEIDFGNKAGVKVVAADTDHENCFDADVVETMERKMEESEREGVKIGAVLIVNPHNPLGTYRIVFCFTVLDDALRMVRAALGDWC